MKNRVRFRMRVIAVVRRIPLGEVLSYQEVATQAGNRKAARVVGAIMRANHDPAVWSKAAMAKIQ